MKMIHGDGAPAGPERTDAAISARPNLRSTLHLPRLRRAAKRPGVGRAKGPAGFLQPTPSGAAAGGLGAPPTA